MTKKEKDTERDEAITRLRNLVKEGDTIYTVLKHVSSTGMSRAIDVYKIEKNEPIWLSRLVSTACGFRFSDRYEAVSVGGCGMDMGFHLAYTLGRVLFPNGSKTMVTHRNGETKPETDGGYLLKHKWM